MKHIPEIGLAQADVLEQLASHKHEDANYLDSKTWSLVYHLNEEHTEFLKQSYGAYFSENALNPMAFKSLKQFETDIINMTGNMLNGGEDIVGTVTSGGTESCLLPVLAYRERARSKHRLRYRPEMIVPESVHVAWTKAAKYFNVKIHYAPLREDLRVDVAAVKKLINRKTIMLVGSAPSYPHGVIDPIEELGQLAQQHKLPFHVDSCLGGFLLPFMEKNGVNLPLFDFRVPGVTSMSADVHKYGFAAKGASTVLYRDMSYLKHQFFIDENWPGGVFASPALLGTRPGGAYAAAWSALHVLGENGYRQNAEKIMDITKRLQSGIRNISGLKILSNPDMSVFSYTSTDPGLNIFAVGDQLEETGWHVDRLQKPDALHVMIVPGHEKVIDFYLSDLEQAVQVVRGNPGLASRGNAAMYGMIAHLPMRGMIKKEVMKMMEDMYSPQGGTPLDGAENPLLIQWGAKLLNRLQRGRKSS